MPPSDKKPDDTIGELKQRIKALEQELATTLRLAHKEQEKRGKSCGPNCELCNPGR